MVVRNIDDVVLGDVHSARHDARPLGQILSVLVEDLYTLVDAVAHEEPALGVEGHAVGLVELPGTRPCLAPRHDEFPVLVEFHDPIVAVSVDHEDVAIGSNSDVGRTIEGVLPVTGDAGSAEGHQERPVLGELHDLMALVSDSAGIRCPDVSVRIDEKSVGPVEHPFAPTVQ